MTRIGKVGNSEINVFESGEMAGCPRSCCSWGQSQKSKRFESVCSRTGILHERLARYYADAEDIDILIDYGSRVFLFGNIQIRLK